MSGLRKAAIVVLSLEKPLAAEVLSQLAKEEVEALTMEITVTAQKVCGGTTCRTPLRSFGRRQPAPVSRKIAVIGQRPRALHHDRARV